MPNKWTEFVKEFAAKHNLSYSCAMTRQECKDAYRAANPIPSKSTKRRKNLKKQGLNPYSDLATQDITPSQKKKLPPQLKKAIEMSKVNKQIREKKNEIVKNIPIEKLEELFPDLLQDEEPEPPKKKEEPKITAATKVFDIKGLKGHIESYLPKINKSKLDDLTDSIKNFFSYWERILYDIGDSSLEEAMTLKYKTTKQKTIVRVEASQTSNLISVQKSLLEDRLKWLAEKSDLEVDEDDLYYDNLEDTDYYRVVGYGEYVNYDYTLNTIDEIYDKSISNYVDLMKEMGINETEARKVLNKRLENRGINFRIPEAGKKGTIAEPPKKKEEPKKAEPPKKKEEPPKETIAEPPKKKEEKTKFLKLDGQRLELKNAIFGNNEKGLATARDKFGNRLLIKDGSPWGVDSFKANEYFEINELSKEEAYDIFGKEAADYYYKNEFLVWDDTEGKGIKIKGYGTGYSLMDFLNNYDEEEHDELIRDIKESEKLDKLITDMRNDFDSVRNTQEYRAVARKWFNIIQQGYEDEAENSKLTSLLFNDTSDIYNQLSDEFNIVAPETFERVDEPVDGNILPFNDITKLIPNQPVVCPTCQHTRGTGMKDWVSPTAWKEYGQAVVKGRNDYQPKMRQILEKYGKIPILKMYACRTPVSSLLTSALNAVSLGAFNQKWANQPYDKLFHLDLRIELATRPQTTILLEKNEVLNAVVNPKPPGKDTECTYVPKNKQITILQLLEGAKQIQGDNFFKYSAYNNNCQDFIIALLRGSGQGNQENYDFIKQNTQELFKGLPGTRKFANTVTDIGAVANTIIEGASLSDWFGFRRRGRVVPAESIRNRVNRSVVPEFVRQAEQRWSEFYEPHADDAFHGIRATNTQRTFPLPQAEAEYVVPSSSSSSNRSISDSSVSSSERNSHPNQSETSGSNRSKSDSSFSLSSSSEGEGIKGRGNRDSSDRPQRQRQVDIIREGFELALYDIDERIDRLISVINHYNRIGDFEIAENINMELNSLFNTRNDILDRYQEFGFSTEPNTALQTPIITPVRSPETSLRSSNFQISPETSRNSQSSDEELWQEIIRPETSRNSQSSDEVLWKEIINSEEQTTDGTGIHKGDNYYIQSIVFEKPKWNLKSAKKWLKDNNYVNKGPDEKETQIRFRQVNPQYIQSKGFKRFRTKKIGRKTGISLIISYK